ncbi:class I SAM-dependent methyltransferase [Mycobacterium sp. NPDC051804]|uniref:class I SAM-dependent methyltransferase n=1 Tax=Mycobacterium sp. NPDC051804 TaxID=3364295 RepID=UPI0037B4EE37
MDDIISFLEDRGHLPTEGSSSPEQQDYLRRLVERSGALLVGEIGFNAGFSSLGFLSANADVKVVSFDIGCHDVVGHAKEFVDAQYPGRHELIIGDSALTVPNYGKDHPATAFDVVFIDGGHEYEQARDDIANMKALSHPGTWVVLDDLTPWFWWGEGPTRAWTEAIAQGAIDPVEMYKDGQLVDEIAPPGERSWGLGRYRFD